MTAPDRAALRAAAENPPRDWWLNDEWIAAANPTAVLALLDELGALLEAAREGAIALDVAIAHALGVVDCTNAVRAMELNGCAETLTTLRAALGDVGRGAGGGS